MSDIVDKNFLNEFTFKSIISESSRSKVLVVHATHKETSQDAIIIFEKPQFNENEVKALIQNEYGNKMDIKNDIFHKLQLYPSIPFNNVQVQVVYPATQSHLIKYSQADMYMIEESYDDYLNITMKFVEPSLKKCQWVLNILDHKKEAERIVFEDVDPKNGFILLPDIKWDGTTVENLYLLAIVHRRDIKSLRDLNESHLSLLENIRAKSCEHIKLKYKIDSSKLRAYIHYQPSFYHLHIHFTHIKFESHSTECEKSHLLNHVIQNIKLHGNYYQKVALSCLVKKGDDLFKLYENRLV